MIYLLEKYGQYQAYNINANTTKDRSKYYAVYDDTQDKRKYLLDVVLGRMPFNNTHSYKFKTEGTEAEIRQLDFLSNGTTERLVSSKVVDFFQLNYSDSVEFFNTIIHTADSVINDYKIMVFTILDQNLYDKEKSRFAIRPNYSYLQHATYFDDCLQGRPIVVNADLTVDVLISDEVAQKLLAHNFKLLGLTKPRTTTRTK